MTTASSQASLPVYENLHYEQGYVPNSLEAPHSSLHTISIWVCMGLWLASVAFIGTAVYAAAVIFWGDFSAAGTYAGPNGVAPIQESNGMLYLIIGIVGTIVLWIAGYVFYVKGRANYKAYAKRTGRHS